MSNENNQNGTPMNATTADAPPPPTTNGSSNGTAAHTTTVEPPTDVVVPGASPQPVESAAQAGQAAAATSSKKKDKKRDKKKERDAQNAPLSVTPSDAPAPVAAGSTTTPAVTNGEAPKPDAVTTAVAPAQPQPVNPASAPPVVTQPPSPASEASVVTQPASPASEPPIVTQSAPPASEPPIMGAPPITTREGGLRLRMKVWTDPETLKRYLMTTAFMRDMVNGRPVSDVMVAYAMSEEDTRVVTLHVYEWNTLPFFYFQEDGPAPRASRRPVDRIG